MDQLCVNGRGYHNEVVTIGVVIYCASDISGHGPCDNPILSIEEGRIETSILPNSNIAL